MVEHGIRSLWPVPFWPDLPNGQMGPNGTGQNDLTRRESVVVGMYSDGEALKTDFH